MNVALTTEDISKAIDRLCETYEGCGFDRSVIACELEAKAFELRGDQEDNRTTFSDADLVAFMPLP